MRSCPLTIFTPTYNRSGKLKVLYQSLVTQTCYDFEWLIIDDGSDDDTKATVANWCESSPFPIRYLWQENSGKHVAHNWGASEANGFLFMCVDSDDWLEPDAVETVLGDAAFLKPDEGLLYPRMFVGQTSLERWFPKNVKKIEIADMRIKYGLNVESAIVFKTAVLRRHPFPVVSEEKYLPEEAAYFDFREPESFHVCNSSFYRGKYQEDGLTKNIWLNWYNNPKGTILALRKRYEASQRYTGWNALKNRISAVVGIESLNIALQEPICREIPCKPVLAILFFPVSVILERMRFQECTKKTIE